MEATLANYSRQRRWQMARLAHGKCIICGKGQKVNGKCNLCIEKNRLAARNRARIKSGIPLDTPVKRRGVRMRLKPAWRRRFKVLAAQ